MAPVLQGPGASGATLQGFHQGFRGQAQAIGEGQGFSDGGIAPGHQHLIDGFGLLPRANGTEVVQAAADHLQDGPGPCEGGSVSSDQDPQGSRLGPFGSTGDGGVDVAHPLAR